MPRDLILALLVVVLGMFEWWGCRMDERLEAWARGDDHA